MWLEFSGERFDSSQDYVCLFDLQESTTDTSVSAKTDLEVLSTTSVRCKTPDPSTYLAGSGTHSL